MRGQVDDAMAASLLTPLMRTLKEENLLVKPRPRRIWRDWCQAAAIGIRNRAILRNFAPVVKFLIANGRSPVSKVGS